MNCLLDKTYNSILVYDKTLKSLFGKICWDVYWTNVGNLALQFGKPYVNVVREPRRTASKNENVRRNARRRIVAICGQWKIWIYNAHWRIIQSGKCIATGYASYRKKYLAMQGITGQQLINIEVNSHNGMTKFVFDLGAVLEVRRKTKESNAELWILYGEKGYERSMYGDGTFN